MQIKTTTTYHLTPVSMAIINKSTNTKCWQRCGERGTLMHCWWECRLVQPLWKAVWSYLQKLKMELTYDPEIPLLDTYPKKPKTPIWNICMWNPMFIVALFSTAKIWKQPKCLPTDNWIKKWCIYTMEYYSAIKRMKSYHFNSVDGPRGYCAEWNKSVRERQIPHDFTYMLSLKNKIN